MFIFFCQRIRDTSPLGPLLFIPRKCVFLQLCHWALINEKASLPHKALVLRKRASWPNEWQPAKKSLGKKHYLAKKKAPLSQICYSILILEVCSTLNFVDIGWNPLFLAKWRLFCSVTHFGEVSIFCPSDAFTGAEKVFLNCPRDASVSKWLVPFVENGHRF